MSEHHQDERLALEAWLPPLSALTNSTGEATPRSSYWTDEEISRAIRGNIRAQIKRGWKFRDGKLVSPDGVESPPSGLMPSKSGNRDFNPRTDAFAVRMGAEFVSDNRYFYRGLGEYMDRNGMFVPGPNEECLECGGMPWHVKTRKGLSLNAPPWAYNLTYCRRCVSQEEVEEMRERQFLREQQEQSRQDRRRGYQQAGSRARAQT